MRPNPQFPADLVTFTEEILNRKLHFLCTVLIRGVNLFYSNAIFIYLIKTSAN